MENSIIKKDKNGKNVIYLNGVLKEDFDSKFLMFYNNNGKIETIKNDDYNQNNFKNGHPFWKVSISLYDNDFKTEQYIKDNFKVEDYNNETILKVDKRKYMDSVLPPAVWHNNNKIYSVTKDTKVCLKLEIQEYSTRRSGVKQICKKLNLLGVKVLDDSESTQTNNIKNDDIQNNNNTTNNIELVTIQNEMKGIRNVLKEMCLLMKDMSDEITSLKNENESIKSELLNITKELKNLKNIHSTSDSIEQKNNHNIDSIFETIKDINDINDNNEIDMSIPEIDFDMKEQVQDSDENEMWF